MKYLGLIQAVKCPYSEELGRVGFCKACIHYKGAYIVNQKFALKCDYEEVSDSEHN